MFSSYFHYHYNFFFLYSDEGGYDGDDESGGMRGNLFLGGGMGGVTLSRHMGKEYHLSTSLLLAMFIQVSCK